MRVPTLLAWLVGAAILGALIAFNQPQRLLDGIVTLRGWLALVVLFHVLPLWLDARAWQLLFRPRPPFHTLFFYRWIAEGLNGLLPLPYLGELERARLGSRITGNSEGAATVVVDVTLGVVTQALFALMGLALLGTLPIARGLFGVLIPAIALVGAGGIAFYFLQRAGLFGLAGRIIHRLSESARGSFDLSIAHALDTRVREVYGRRHAVMWAAVWRLAGWIAGAGEAWIVFFALGHPIGIANALILESLSQAARTAAFFIPGGLGVQDGALLLLGSQLGLGPEAGLVLALAKRFRELSLGIPAMIAGYVLETRHLVRMKAAPPTSHNQSSLRT
jgi:putative membrane protein